MDSPKVGDFVECAVWLDGSESPEQIERWKTNDCAKALSLASVDGAMVIGQVEFETKYPGEDRVPPVPGHIDGIDVRLLVATGKVVGVKSIQAPVSIFLQELDPRDLERLRYITRSARAKAKPGEPPLTNAECDAIIERIGPTAAMNAVREAVDGCLIH